MDERIEKMKEKVVKKVINTDDLKLNVLKKLNAIRSKKN